ncbi:MAG TPA: metal ABC transporter permease, partial [Candidatus Methylomirabilis sp.]
AIAMAAGLLAVTAGLIAAYYLRLAAGGAIVLTALLLFAAGSLGGRALGRLWGGATSSMVSAAPPV